ncbi:MAG TPA: GNAT family N-acetyltransferase [Polyangiaceae bacterium]|nr:GNAT family N-acetyltransferase [Polyangiaceae bacterium]
MRSVAPGDESTVTVELATQADSTLLANLLELYMHDLSEIFPVVQLGPEGRFGYPRLSSYWSEPEARFPFLIRKHGKVVGFALAQRGSPLSDDPEVLDVAEFFVLRNVRHAGVGARAAELLWDRLPGRWIVRVSEGNSSGLPFWTRVIERYAGSAATQTQRHGEPYPWRVFAFDTRARRSRGEP